MKIGTAVQAPKRPPPRREKDLARAGQFASGHPPRRLSFSQADGGTRSVPLKRPMAG